MNLGTLKRGRSCLGLCFVAALLVIVAMNSRGPAQEGCRQLTISLAPAGPNIFTEDQEVDLGDASAQEIEQNLRTTDEPQVTTYLESIGGRIVKQLPPTHLRFRYYLVDLAVPNAFALAGGRIYVSRKLAAFVKSEDELAGILAHEMGHIVTHQSAVKETYLLGKVLGINRVGDRRDIFTKYAELMAGWRRNPQAFRKLRQQQEKHQEVADQAGLEAMAAAGYNPQAAADTFDRLAELGGRTGSWLSDFLGTTPPDARRLHEIVKGIESLPPACKKEHPPASGNEFQAWQASVIQYTGWKRREVLEGVLSRVQLEPLRAQLSHVRFSPDGRYILAQDVDKIYVLSREPLAVVFHIEAEGARPAEFTPDSRSVVWHDSRLRVESWDIQTQKRTSAYEPVVPKGCNDTRLSPDGKTLACLGTDSTLRLLDVATGSILLEKKNFKGTVFNLGSARFLLFAGMAFSPDNRYFLAGNSDQSFGFDLQNRSEMALRAGVKKVLNHGFVFVGPDRLFGWDSEARFQADLVSFPGGKLHSHLQIRPFGFGAVTRGDFVLLISLTDESVGALNLNTFRAEKTFKRRGVDIYGNLFAEELADGELGLFETDSFKLLARAKLPGGDLTRPSAASVAGDLKWLALSEKERGTVWNLSTGKILYLVREFDGAYLDRDAFYADFPKHGEAKRAIARFDLNRKSNPGVMNVEDEYAHQHGRYLVVTIPAKKAPFLTQFNSDVTREVHDVVNGRTLWKRDFPKEAPALAVEPMAGTITLTWRASAGAAREEAKKFPKVYDELVGMKDTKTIDFVEVLEAWTGKPMGAVLVDTNKGSIVIEDQFAVADWLFITTAQNQVLVYSFSREQKVGEVLGKLPSASKTAGLMCVRAEADQLALYDLNSMELIREYAFSSPVVLKEFSADGNRLLVLTADQTAYQLDVAALTQLARAGAAPASPGP